MHLLTIVVLATILTLSTAKCFQQGKLQDECVIGDSIYFCSPGAVNESIFVGLSIPTKSNWIGCLEFSRKTREFLRGWNAQLRSFYSDSLEWKSVERVQSPQAMDLNGALELQTQIHQRVLSTIDAQSQEHEYTPLDQPSYSFFVWREMLAQHIVPVYTPKAPQTRTQVQYDSERTTWVNFGSNYGTELPFRLELVDEADMTDSLLSAYRTTKNEASTLRPAVLGWIPSTSTTRGSTIMQGPHIGFRETPLAFRVIGKTEYVPESMHIYLHQSKWSFRASSSASSITPRSAMDILRSVPMFQQHEKEYETQQSIPKQRALWGTGDRRVMQMYSFDPSNIQLNGNLESPNLISTEGWVPFVDMKTNSCAILRESSWAIWAMTQEFTMPTAFQTSETIVMSQLLQGTPRLKTPGIPVTNWLDVMLRQTLLAENPTFQGIEVDFRDQGIWTLWKVPTGHEWTVELSESTQAAWPTIVWEKSGILVFTPISAFQETAQTNVASDGRLYAVQIFDWIGRHLSSSRKVHLKIQIPWENLTHQTPIVSEQLKISPVVSNDITNTIPMTVAPLASPTYPDRIVGAVVSIPESNKHNVSFISIQTYGTPTARDPDHKGHFLSAQDGLGFALFMDDRNGALFSYNQHQLQNILVEMSVGSNDRRVWQFPSTLQPLIAATEWMATLRDVPIIAQHLRDQEQNQEQMFQTSSEHQKDFEPNAKREQSMIAAFWLLGNAVFILCILLCTPCVWVRLPCAKWNVLLMYQKQQQHSVNKDTTRNKKKTITSTTTTESAFPTAPRMPLMPNASYQPVMSPLPPSKYGKKR